MNEMDFNNGKGSGFKVPKDYFQELEMAMDAKISEDNLKSNVANTGYTIPEDYFETLEQSISSKIKPQQPTKVIKLYDRPVIKVAIAIAAMLVVYFSFIHSPLTSTNFQKLETSSIDSYLSDMSFTNDELANLLENEELNLSYLEETQINKDALQSYFEDQLIIDDLINE